MEKLYIIKIGGNTINNEEKLRNFLSDISQIQEKKIIVHGGGKLLNEFAEKLNIEQQMIDGRRVTDADTLDLATMVYAGFINKKIVALLQANQTDAMGLSGADNNCILAQKRTNAEYDFGFVGDIVDINNKFISLLLQNHIIPVFCSITHNQEGQLLNTNADSIASALAVEMSSKYEVQLCYCFEMNGVMRDTSDEKSLMSKISSKEYHDLISNKIISQGMIPKLQNAFEAIKQGVKLVVILKAEDMLKHINEEGSVGTILFN